MTSSRNPQPERVAFLSDLISDIPTNKRMRFVANLKNAIRSNVFDGGPINEQFDMHYTGRGERGEGETKQVSQRDYAIERTPGFEDWYAAQTAAPVRRSQFANREDVAAGNISIKDLAEKYRRRTGGNGIKRKRK